MKDTILDTIIENKIIEIEEAKKSLPLKFIAARLKDFEAPRDFFGAINPGGALKIIAEIKHASPSKGIFRQDFDPVKIARGYSDAGASALSVLTDEKFFKGSLTYLSEVREAVGIPLMRKDFIVDPYQVYEARYYGADAILLIVAALRQDMLKELLNLSRALDLSAVVEVHNESELEQALEAGSLIIGINNRDLRTFEVDLGVSVRLSKKVPPEVIVIAESGIGSSEGIRRLREEGVHVFLIGETFMKAPDPGAELKKLISSC